ncbi:hypothetical protein EJB05_16356, partial [Eragrostis curvula]
MEDTPPPLPLALGPPHLIPPAPTRDTRAIAFLPDLGGFPWAIADESPFFRQVIDLRVPVSAVSWCGSGGGEVAAAAANSVSVFQPVPSSSAVWNLQDSFVVSRDGPLPRRLLSLLWPGRAPATALWWSALVFPCGPEHSPPGSSLRWILIKIRLF